MTLLPVAKLGYLAIRTAAKPVANALKRQAANAPKFRKTCIRMAQFYNYWEVNMSLKLMGKVPQAVRPLNEERAVALATEVIGEFMLFSVAGAVIVVEVASSKAKENAKEEEAAQRFAQVQTELATAQEDIQRLELAVRELTIVTTNFEHRSK